MCALERRRGLGFAASPRALAPGPLGARPRTVGALPLVGAQVARVGVCDTVWVLWGAGRRWGHGVQGDGGGYRCTRVQGLVAWPTMVWQERLRTRVGSDV